MCTAAFPSARLMLTILGFFGMVNCYTLRVNLSVALVAMVNTTYLHELEASAHHDNSTSASVCAVDEDANATKTVDEHVRTIKLFFFVCGRGFAKCDALY